MDLLAPGLVFFNTILLGSVVPRHSEMTVTPKKGDSVL